MKHKNKIITILIIIIITCFSTVSMATFNTENFKPDPLTPQDYGKAFEIADTIISTITLIGTVISIVMVITLGIKYMTASIEQKADYKKTMMPMLIGAILIFSSSWFVSLIYNMVSKM